MAVVVLDADVVIGLLDEDDAHHTAAAQLLDRHVDDAVYMAASAYSEVLVQPARDGRADVVRSFVREADIGVLHIDRDVAERAAALRAEHRSLRLPDALSLAAAENVGAQLLTFDERLLRVRDRP